MSDTDYDKVERVRLTIAVVCAVGAVLLLASGTALALGMWAPVDTDPRTILYAGFVASVPAAFFGFRLFIWPLVPFMVGMFVWTVFLTAGHVPDGPLYAGAS